MTTATVLSAHEWAVEVDSHLATLWEARAAAVHKRGLHASTLHYNLGERRGRGGGFPTTDAEAVALITERLESIPAWDRRSIERALAEVATIQTEIEALSEEINTFEGLYEGWQRFYLVKNNGGHIHSSMNCSTCNKMGKATYFGWLPDLSGLTEAEAVAAHGTILCSVCFPSAPVEWTLGKAKPAGCEGSGTYVEPTDRSYRRYATCPVCNEVVARTSTGVLRKHKPKESS